MLQIKRSVLSTALASAVLITATSAVQAQQAPQDEAQTDTDAETLDAVVVTGIRRGIENAIETKQTADSIVESVSAEDIGKLPDASIAESVARLPGLAAQRVAGRASTISIRGLAENFGTTLLNGREQVSVAHNRGVEFDQYPSELMSAVTVHKTPTASLIGQGLSGTVNLQTVMPLSFPERVISLNVRGEYADIGKLNAESSRTGYRVSGSYIDQFLDGTVGLAIGYARLDSPAQSRRWEAWGYQYDNSAAMDQAVLGGSKAQASSTDNVRDGLMAVLEYKPSDTYHTTLDAYYSRFDKSQTLRFMESGLGWSGAQLVNPVFDTDGVMIGGTFNNVRTVLRNDLNTQTDTMFAAGWKNEFRFGENWSALADISYSKAERDEMVLETYSGLGPSGDPAAADSVNVRIDRNKGLTYLDYGRNYTDPAQIVLTDAGGWAQDGYVKYPHVEDAMTSLRLGAERSFSEGIFRSVEFGVNHAHREKSRAAGLEAILRIPGGSMAIPSGMLRDPVDLGLNGIAGSIAYDPMAAFGLYTLEPKMHNDIRNKTWEVSEKMTTGYVQWNVNADWGSIPVRGNVGLQVIHTDQSSVGFAVNEGDGAATPMSGGDTYNDILPSLNLAFGLPHEQTLRVGLGQQMARPRMDQMRANHTYNVPTSGQDVGRWFGTGGNPELKPWRATAFDISYEKYFGGRGYFALAGFHKDLHSWVKETRVPYDFSGHTPPPGSSPISNQGLFTRPENVNGGIIYGFEASLSIPFDLLWQPLDGFGLVASYTNTHSRVEPDGPGTGAIDLPGLSREVSNITLYYEKYGFSTRVSQRKRSPFLGEVIGYGGDQALRYVNSESVVDFQIGYAFPESTALSGLSLLLQVNNVTDEPYREYFSDTGLPQKYEEYGRTVLFGATYKF